MFERTPVKIREHIDSGRLLVVYPFDITIKRIHRELTFKRNQFIVDNADEVVFAHIHAGGMLERVIVSDCKAVRVLDGNTKEKPEGIIDE